jgi:hypothetical protein
MTVQLTVLALFAGALCCAASNASAGGYYYRPRSFYVTPPIYANLSVFGQAPIVFYEPVITAPAPLAGYYAPLSEPVTEVPVALPAASIRERQVSTPYWTRHHYDVVYPDGPGYQYRYRRNPGRVRFSEQWAN